jgi:hypothetical protein
MPTMPLTPATPAWRREFRRRRRLSAGLQSAQKYLHGRRGLFELWRALRPEQRTAPRSVACVLCGCDVHRSLVSVRCLLGGRGCLRRHQILLWRGCLHAGLLRRRHLCPGWSFVRGRRPPLLFGTRGGSRRNLPGSGELPPDGCRVLGTDPLLQRGVREFGLYRVSLCRSQRIVQRSFLLQRFELQRRRRCDLQWSGLPANVR